MWTCNVLFYLVTSSVHVFLLITIDVLIKRLCHYSFHSSLTVQRFTIFALFNFAFILWVLIKHCVNMHFSSLSISLFLTHPFDASWSLCINVLFVTPSPFVFLCQRLMEKQTSFDKQLDSLTDLLSEMETRGPFNPKVQSAERMAMHCKEY